MFGRLVGQFDPDRGLTLANLAHRAAESHGHRVAFDTGAASNLRQITYIAFERQVGAVASRLASEIEPHERVVVRVANGMPFLACVLAVSAAGGVAVPVNAELRPAELAHVISDSGARAAVVEDAPETEALLEAGEGLIDRWCFYGAATGEVRAGARAIELPVEGQAAVGGAKSGVGPRGTPGPRDVAAIFYTSGTTGRPKGAMLTHRGLLDDLKFAPLYPARLRRDFLVEALPTSHIMGFLVVAGALAAGIRTVALGKFKPTEVLDVIESRRASLFVGVPAMFRLMLEAGATERDLKSIRAWMSAADVMPRDLARRFQQMGASFAIGSHSLGEALFVEGYGMVEYSGAATLRVSPPYFDLFSESIGIPLPGTKIRIVDDDGHQVSVGEVGEIEIKGSGTLTGYRGRPDESDETLRGDWLRTGDLARRGFVLNHFAGRAKDVIMSGGYSVFAVEIEDDLRRYPGVSDVAVVGVPDTKLGERVVAAIEAEPGTDIDMAELDQWIESEIAGYKRPTDVRLVAALPRGATRKIQKDRVRAIFADLPAPSDPAGPSEAAMADLPDSGGPSEAGRGGRP